MSADHIGIAHFGPVHPDERDPDYSVHQHEGAGADAGDVDVLVSDAGESVYRACGAGHHHHLVCRRCGGAVEIAGPAVEQWADDTARMHGYSEVSHRLEIFGVCPDCQRG